MQMHYEHVESKRKLECRDSEKTRKGYMHHKRGISGIAYCMHATGKKMPNKEGSYRKHLTRKWIRRARAPLARQGVS